MSLLFFRAHELSLIFEPGIPTCPSNIAKFLEVSSKSYFWKLRQNTLTSGNYLGRPAIPSDVCDIIIFDEKLQIFHKNVSEFKIVQKFTRKVHQ